MAELSAKASHALHLIGLIIWAMGGLKQSNILI